MLIILTLHQAITVPQHTFDCILLSTAHIQSCSGAATLQNCFILLLIRPPLLLVSISRPRDPVVGGNLAERHFTA